MTSSEKYLTKHKLVEEISFESFCEAIPEFYFKPIIPKDILQNYEIIERLLAYSYFEYRLIDEAYNKALDTLEMAMNLKYNEIKKTYARLTYPSLIERLYKLDQFETPKEELKQLENTRNHYSHPKSHSYGGYFFWNMPLYICNIINEIYEDVNLRKERIKLRNQFKKLQSKYKLDNHLIFKNGNESIILYKLDLLFVNNKELPNVYHFGLTPLFNLQSNSNTDIGVPGVYEIILTDVIFKNDIIIGIEKDTNCEICFSAVEELNAKKEFEVWHGKYSDKNEVQKTMYDMAIVDGCGEIYFNSFGNFVKK